MRRYHADFWPQLKHATLGSTLLDHDAATWSPLGQADSRARDQPSSFDRLSVLFEDKCFSHHMDPRGEAEIYKSLTFNNALLLLVEQVQPLLSRGVTTNQAKFTEPVLQEQSRGNGIF